VCFYTGLNNNFDDTFLLESLKKLNIQAEYSNDLSNSEDYDLIIPIKYSWNCSNITNIVAGPKKHVFVSYTIDPSLVEYQKIMGTFEVVFIANKFSHVTRKGY